MKSKKTTHIVILGSKWKVRFHTPEDYIKKVADDSKAEIDDDLRTLDMDLQFLSAERFRHELTHCYAKERSFVETQIKTLDQAEEFFAEINGKHGHTLVKQADILFKAGKGLKWRPKQKKTS